MVLTPPRWHGHRDGAPERPQAVADLAAPGRVPGPRINADLGEHGDVGAPVPALDLGLRIGAVGRDQGGGVELVVARHLQLDVIGQRRRLGNRQRECVGRAGAAGSIVGSEVGDRHGGEAGEAEARQAGRPGLEDAAALARHRAGDQPAHEAGPDAVGQHAALGGSQAVRHGGILPRNPSWLSKSAVPYF